MSRPIVVGFDGSDRGRDALTLGRALARTLSVRLIVVLAYTPDQWLWAPGTAEPLAPEERASAAEAATAALDGFERAEFRTLASPSAAGALQAEAERENAQIIVVGSSHRGTLGRIMLGTVTEGVLDASSCAVAIAPLGLAGREPRFARVGVGFDDSPSAHDALAVAHAFARTAGSQIRVVWAAHLAARALPLAALSYMDADYLAEVRGGIEERLSSISAPIREEMPVTAEIVAGETVAALEKQSERLDLLVLGSRGYGPLARVLLGSVSRKLANRAHCPVLVVPRGVRALDGSDATEPGASTLATPPAARS